MRTKITVLYALVIGGNFLAWLWAFIALHDYPVLLGTAFLAYTFGLRHGVDADHIAAIDNVTRKLMQDGQRPAGVGFFFSLGHSTVVVIASAVIALATSALQDRFVSFKAVGGVVGTLVSAFFLFLVAAASLPSSATMKGTRSCMRPAMKWTLRLSRSSLATGLEVEYASHERSAPVWHLPWWSPCLDTPASPSCRPPVRSVNPTSITARAMAHEQRRTIEEQTSQTSNEQPPRPSAVYGI